MGSKFHLLKVKKITLCKNAFLKETYPTYETFEFPIAEVYYRKSKPFFLNFVNTSFQRVREEDSKSVRLYFYINHSLYKYINHS